jgi:hypothetical protein
MLCRIFNNKEGGYQEEKDMQICITYHNWNRHCKKKEERKK